MKWNSSRVIVAAILAVLVVSVVVRLATRTGAFGSSEWTSILGAAFVFALGVAVFIRKGDQ